MYSIQNEGKPIKKRKKKINYMLNGETTMVLLTVGLIKKT